MAWNRLQSKSASSSTLTNSITPTSNLTSGSKLLAFVTVDNTASISTVKDANNNSFSQIDTITSSPAGELTYIYVLDTPAGDVGTTPAITATCTGTANGQSLLVMEVTGLATGTTAAACLDGTAGHSSGSTSLAPGGTSQSVGAYTSALANEFLVLFYGDNGDTIGSTTTLPSGYTADASNISSDSNDDVRVYYKNSTGGSESPSSITSAGGSNTFTWCIDFVAFKLAATGGGAFAQQQKRRFRGGIRPTQTIIPPFAGSVTVTGTLSLTGSASFTDPTVTFNPPATEIAALSVTAASSLTENATELSNLTFTAASSMSDVATQQAVLTLTGSSSFAQTATQIAIAAFTAGASLVSNATQIAALTVTAASSFTTNATQIAGLTLTAVSSFLSNATQVCGLALNAASSIVLNAGGAVTGTISMTASAVWSSAAQLNSPVTFSAASTFTGNVVQSASVALSALASAAFKPVQIMKTAFSAAASWAGSLVTGTLYGTSDVGGRELGGSAGSARAPDNYPATGTYADNYPKKGQAPDSSAGGRAL